MVVPYGRLVERGYNQAALLARPLVGELGARFASLALHRVDGSVSLNRKHRLENLRGAFSVRQRWAVEGRTVLLVDDVGTVTFIRGSWLGPITLLTTFTTCFITAKIVG